MHSGKSRRRGSRHVWGQRLTKKNAARTRVEVRRPADGESLNVERGFLEPRGIVDDEDERAETDLAAQDQIAARRHDEDWKTQPRRKVA